MKFTDVVISQDQPRFVTVRYLAESGEEVTVKLDMPGSDAASSLAVANRARALLEEAAIFEFSGRGSPEPALVEKGGRPVAGEPLEAESLEEEDDNPYQAPDEALPSRKQERDIEQNPSRERGRFGDY